MAAIPESAPGVGLVGAAVTDHPEIEELVGRIVDGGRRVSLSSIRADRLSPALVAFIAIIPFIAAQLGMTDFYSALVASLVILAITLFLMGIWIGKIAGENLPINGMKMVMVGVLTGLIILVLSMSEAQGFTLLGV